MIGFSYSLDVRSLITTGFQQRCHCFVIPYKVSGVTCTMHILWFITETKTLSQDAARVAAQKLPGTPSPCYSNDRAHPLIKQTRAGACRAMAGGR